MLNASGCCCPNSLHKPLPLQAGMDWSNSWLMQGGSIHRQVPHLPSQARLKVWVAWLHHQPHAVTAEADQQCNKLSLAHMSTLDRVGHNFMMGVSCCKGVGFPVPMASRLCLRTVFWYPGCLWKNALLHCLTSPVGKQQRHTPMPRVGAPECWTWGL